MPRGHQSAVSWSADPELQARLPPAAVGTSASPSSLPPLLPPLTATPSPPGRPSSGCGSRGAPSILPTGTVPAESPSDTSADSVALAPPPVGPLPHPYLCTPVGAAPRQSRWTDRPLRSSASTPERGRGTPLCSVVRTLRSPHQRSPRERGCFSGELFSVHERLGLARKEMPSGTALRPGCFGLGPATGANV